jgi:hypothetical protein
MPNSAARPPVSRSERAQRLLAYRLGLGRIGTAGFREHIGQVGQALVGGDKVEQSPCSP